ncbi:MAG: hypothetical protein D6755_07980 [Anaerolineae bacterium]|nr:MAG: hypothetical protein D6755_07980 [Anaerolineae bacterium]
MLYRRFGCYRTPARMMRRRMFWERRWRRRRFRPLGCLGCMWLPLLPFLGLCALLAFRLITL